ncbi:UNVERIFIED_CONTAM: hypothetical protein K2H54_051950 [Gekko kuhli]
MVLDKPTFLRKTRGACVAAPALSCGPRRLPAGFWGQPTGAGGSLSGIVSGQGRRPCVAQPWLTEGAEGSAAAGNAPLVPPGGATVLSAPSSLPPERQMRFPFLKSHLLLPRSLRSLPK